MTKRDSYLVKRIKKLERLANGAHTNSFGTAWVPKNSAEGDMAEAMDHIHEVVHEALIRYDEKKKEEKLEEEREKWEQKKARLKQKNTPAILLPATQEKPWNIIRWLKRAKS